MNNTVNNIEYLIGNTPLYRLNAIEQKYNLNTQLYAKLESYNLTGSIKDRAALFMIKDVEKKGLLNSKSVIVEASSGNTGIGLAAISRSLGYKCTIVMPESMSKERRSLITLYGADLVLSPSSEGMSGAKRIAGEIIQKDKNAVTLDQFSNPSNVEAHYKTTGPEILKELSHPDIFISPFGTGGTVTGTGRYLKENYPSVKVVGVEPYESRVVTFFIKKEDFFPSPHKIQGIGAGFIPKNLDISLLDEVYPVKSDDAINMTKEICENEALLVGISSGSALCAAIAIAKRQENYGKNIVMIFPDTGTRYLSMF